MNLCFIQSLISIVTKSVVRMEVCECTRIYTFTAKGFE
jgi:hypothetical protein